MISGWRLHARLILALFVVGVSLRVQFAGVPPLIPRIQDEFVIPYSTASALTAIPVLFLGLMAFGGPTIARMIGTRRALFWGLVVILVLSLLRAAAPESWVLLALTIPIGAAMGLAGAIVPATAHHLSQRAKSLAIGAYTMGLQFGTGGAAAIAGPLATALSGWRAPLVLIALPLIVTVATWKWSRIGAAPRALLYEAETRVRRPTQLGLILMFGGQSAAFHSTATWLPAHLQQSGWNESSAGLALGLLNSLAVVGTIVAAAWVRSFTGRQLAAAIGAALLAIALPILALLPDTAVIWILVAGLAFGLLFPISLTLPLDVSRDERQALSNTAIALGYGYMFASAVAYLTGVIRDLVGDFVPVFILLGSMGPLLLAVSISLLKAQPAEGP